MINNVEDNVGAEINAIHDRVLGLVQKAVPIMDGRPESNTPKAQREEAMQELITEGITSLIVLAGSVASIGTSLKGIHEELVKANEPTPDGLMTRKL